jgi:hypothetical protein
MKYWAQAQASAGGWYDLLGTYDLKVAVEYAAYHLEKCDQKVRVVERTDTVVMGHGVDNTTQRGNDMVTQEELQRIANGLIDIETGCLYIRDSISLREGPLSYKLRANETINKKEIIRGLAKIMSKTVTLLGELTND